MEADYDRILHQLRPMEPRLWPAARLSAPDLASPLSAISEFDNLAGASWSELERSGQICPNRVVCGKHYPNYCTIPGNTFGVKSWEYSRYYSQYLQISFWRSVLAAGSRDLVIILGIKDREVQLYLLFTIFGSAG